MADGSAPPNKAPNKSKKSSKAQHRKSETLMPHDVAIMSVELKAQEVQQLFKRTYQPTDNAMFWLDQIMDRVSDEEIKIPGASKDQLTFNKVMVLIEQRIDDCDQELTKEFDRLLKMKKDNGVNMKLVSKNTVTTDVELHHQYSVKYLNLIMKMDEILNEASELYFANVFTRDQKQRLITNLRTLITKVSRIAIDTNTRAQKLHREAKNRRNEVDTENPQVSEELTNAETGADSESESDKIGSVLPDDKATVSSEKSEAA